MTALSALLALLALAGCAQIVVDGGKPGIGYYDPKPSLLVTLAGDCTVASKVVAMPGPTHSLRFKSGYGSAKLSAKFDGGLLTEIGQETDTKVPETLTAIGNLAGSVAKLTTLKEAASKPPCTPQAHLYPIDANGVPDKHKDLLALSFP